MIASNCSLPRMVLPEKSIPSTRRSPRSRSANSALEKIAADELHVVQLAVAPTARARTLAESRGTPHPRSCTVGSSPTKRWSVISTSRQVLSTNVLSVSVALLRVTSSSTDPSSETPEIVALLSVQSLIFDCRVSDRSRMLEALAVRSSQVLPSLSFSRETFVPFSSQSSSFEAAISASSSELPLSVQSHSAPPVMRRLTMVEACSELPQKRESANCTHRTARH